MKTFSEKQLLTGWILRASKGVWADSYQGTAVGLSSVVMDRTTASRAARRRRQAGTNYRESPHGECMSR